MSLNSHQIKSYFSYWLDAVDEHSLHSPFFFDFHTGVVKAKHAPNEIAENLRRKLLVDNRSISFTAIGAKTGYVQKSVSSIAKVTLTPKKYASLYSRIINKYKHQTIVELGTSLGINTLYLASSEGTHVHTFEGIDKIADIARITFEFAGASNIYLVEGNINSTLPLSMFSLRKIDFALMDANHTYEATVRYFNNMLPKLHARSIVVIDDIYYSAEMTKAWREIKNHSLVYGSADLYRCGILFFDPSLNKQHVILQF